jgi:hypothetical protein
MKDVDGESVAHEGRVGWKTSGTVKAVFMAERFWSPSIKDWTLTVLGERIIALKANTVYNGNAWLARQMIASDDFRHFVKQQGSK